MKYDKIALFTDLDGTLLNSQRQVSPENLQAISRFVAEGGLFAISTGRAPVNALDVLPELPINTWSVVLNGAESYHFPRSEAAHMHTLPQDRMRPLIDWVLARYPEINVQVCTQDRLLFFSDPQYQDRDFVDTHQPMSFVDVTAALASPWLKALFCGPREILEQIQTYAEQTGVAETVACVFSTYTYLEFLPRNVSKGACLHMLRQQEELRGRTFIAIGDYSNDIELLKEADIAVTVDNALPEVKAIAHHITRSNDDHALADLIERIIPAL